MLVEQLAQVWTRPGSLRLRAGEVDGDGHLAALTVPSSAIWVTTSCRTRRVSGWISPVCSASGMKSSGMTRPCTGWFQRTSASTPTTSPVLRFIRGW